LVTGRVYAPDYASPTPSNLTTAIGDMEIAYTDAAGRTNPNYTELYSGDLTGQTLIPGLYKWSTGVLISAAGVTIAGGVNDIWIFQISQNLTVADGAIITLSGGAKPYNIFWQVAGQTTIGTTAQFKGIILCQTLISLNTNASLNGRLLAQTAVTTDGNNVVEPVSYSIFDPHAGTENFLISNYPNPFNLRTTISFNVTREINEITEIEIYNLKGQKVESFRFDQLSIGQHSVVWNGTDGMGKPVTPGIYFYKIKTGSFEQTRKMVLMK